MMNQGQPQGLGAGNPNEHNVNVIVGRPDEPDVHTGRNTTQARDYLYRLMVSQMFYDGFSQMAVGLTNVIQPDPPCPPSDRLYNVVMLGLEREAEIIEEKKRINKEKILRNPRAPQINNGLLTDCGTGIDLEFETDVDVTSVPEPAIYETAYVTSHKGACRSGAFSADGTLVATGSVDSSIKVLDVDRMLAKSGKDPQRGAQPDSHQDPGHPVIRTLYDHFEEVTCLKFHPKQNMLASGSRDCTIKLFDYSKVSAKKSMRSICDASHIECLTFHPSGDYLAVGVMQPVTRVYDVNTGQCFVASNPIHQHQGSVVSVDWSSNGKTYVTGSLDGSIKVWDGVSSNCITTFAQAHDGAEVSSVQFTRNGKYVLSSGRDSLVKLWELSTTRCLIAYTGAGATGKQEFLAQAVFNHTEDFVMFPDEATTSLCCWDSRSAARKQLLSLGHNGCVRHITHSPVSSAFLTCSDDFRARFWVKRSTN